MGKKAPKAPAAPDPYETARAQGQINRETAIANARLNNVNQYTPYGNLIYKEIDPVDGTPRFESRVELSPEQQQILDYQTQGDIGTAKLGVEQLGRITNAVSTPYSYDGLPETFGGASQEEAIRRAEEALNARTANQYARDEEKLRSRLVNQGIGQGSKAYQSEFDALNRARNDARQQAILGAQQYGQTAFGESLARRQQAIQEYDAQRNAPLNEYTALTSGTQVQNPQFSNTGYAGAAPGDLQGATQNAYNAQLGAYNSKIASNNATSGALLGLGGQLGGSFLGSKAGSAAIAGLFGSDVRLKRDIQQVDENNGHKFYEFNYRDDMGLPKGRFRGVMAQDVLKYAPEAVIEIDGHYAVNYDMLGLKMVRV